MSDTRSTTASARTGRVRIDDRPKHLATRLESGDIAVINVADLDRDSAAALVAATTRVADIDALVPDARAFRLPAEIVGAHEEACRLLTTSGWNMVTFGPDNSVPQAWSRLVAQREAR